MLWMTWRAISGRLSTAARTDAVAAVAAGAVTRSELTAVGEALEAKLAAAAEDTTERVENLSRRDDVLSQLVADEAGLLTPPPATSFTTL